MNDALARSTLGSPSEEYQQRFWARILRTIELQFDSVLSRGPVRASTLNLSDLPTAAAGLKSGDVWNDAGTLKIV
jgi:hypothetical protein